MNGHQRPSQSSSSMKSVGPTANSSATSGFIKSPPVNGSLHTPNQQRRSTASREPSRQASSRGETAGISTDGKKYEALDMNVLLPDQALSQERNLSMWEQASWRGKIYAVADPGSFPSDIPSSTERLGYVSAGVMFLIIVINCVSVMGETYPEYQTQALPIYWVAIEIVCVVIFTIDLSVRFVTCPSRIGFVKDFLNWIDFVAVMPFYLEMFVGVTFAPWLRMLRIIRLARIVRVLKTANAMGLDAVLVAISSSFSGMFLFVAMSGTALLIFATCIYFAERGEFGDDKIWYRPCLRYETHCAARNMTEPSPFQSIPDAFWYTIVTMGTVGYGDVSPKTAAGQFLGVAVMLSGVFVIAFPTMILSGHYDAAAKVQRVIRRTFEQIREKHLDKHPDTTKNKLYRRVGWAEVEAPLPPAIPQGTPLGTPLIPRQSGGIGDSSPKKGTHTTSDVVALFTFRGVPRELRYSRMDGTFYYLPLFHILRDDDGFPSIRVIYGKCGMPTLVQFTLVLDHREARNMATNIIGGTSTSQKVVKCEPGGGFNVRHHSPFDDETHLEAGMAGAEGEQPTESKYKFLSGKARAGYRNSDFPVYFERKRTTTEQHLQSAEESYLSEEQIRQEALASLLGTSLFIQVLVPTKSVRKRITVVTQFFQNTRLHRELELIALHADDDVAEATAFAAKDDVMRLLDGVHKKVDLFNHELCLEHVHKVDRDICETLLSRMRAVKVVHIPAKFRQCVYNGDMLSPEDEVYEIPISLFAADVDDEVEEDSLGYIEVMATPFMGRCIRVDISLDALVVDGV